MKFVDFFLSDQQEALIEKIGKADWGAAHLLARILKEGSFYRLLGDGTLYLLMDGDNPVSFVTLTQQDCVDDKTLSPWLGFVYTYPEYRGHRYSETLLSLASEEARKQGHRKVYLATDHVGLYEKYGFTYWESRIDIYKEECRIYIRNLEESHDR